jgi:hypothetical protein
VATLANSWRRREPEGTTLYRVLADHLETFLARANNENTRGPLPRFVVRELRDFLSCGQLSRGFCRVHCDACGKDDLVAFSCKRRGICPSCGARRMIDTAAWLTDHVLPEVPVRQWVLSLPHRVRYACAFDHRITQCIRRIVVRALTTFYCADARTRAIANARAGAIVSVQRFDSALRLNVHLHSLWPDGVFTCSLRKRAEFHPARQITDTDVQDLVRKIRDRVLRLLRKTGKWNDIDGADQDASDPSLFDTLRAAAIQGRTALGHDAGRADPRIGQGTQVANNFTAGKLCATLDGFSLHAAVRVDACSRDRLERLCRYAARPPIVHERLSLTSSGKVLVKFKKPWRDGSTHVVLDPLTLLERLAALIPAPVVKLITYHGVFASAFPLRDTVVPPPPEQQDTCHHPAAAACSAPSADHSHAADDAGPNACPLTHAPAPETPATPAPNAALPAPTKPRPKPRPRYAWAELLRRVYLADVLCCPNCKGRRRLLAFITDRDSIRAILTHLGLPTQPPTIAPARAPPQPALPFA